MKSSKIFLFIVLATGIFHGCKKGDRDPTISLRSRKARLTGIWIMTSSEFQNKTTIIKDSLYMITISNDNTGYTITEENGERDTNYFHWMFLDKDDRYKAKELLLLVYEKKTYQGTYPIIQLRNNEMSLEDNHEDSTGAFKPMIINFKRI